jgi:hypothetical protein
MAFLKHLYKDLEDYLFSQYKINEIFQIFKDFYGEDKVDIQLNIPLERCISLLSDMSLSDFTLNSEHFISLSNCTKDEIKNLITKYKKDKDICIKKFIAVNSISVYIIVYFPKITVTNEFDESIDIEEVYIRVPINLNGRMNSSFEIIRTKYSYIQYESGYMHSHAHSGISKTSRDWRSMCLGSGPLVTTTHTLKNTYDLDIWRLFCIELDEYLKVESVAGVPYIRMNRVGNNDNLYNYNITDNGYYNIQYTIHNCSYLFKDFLKFFIQKICSNDYYFSFRDKDIHLAISNEQFAIIISRYFIEYCNCMRKITDINIDSIISCFMVKVQRDVSGTLKYYRQTNPRSHTNESLSDIKALTFKGQGKYVKIDAKAETSQNKEIYLLNPELVSQVLNYLLKVINYGNTEEFTTNSKIPYFF